MRIIFDIGGSHMRLASVKSEESFSNPIIKDTPKDFDDGMEVFLDVIDELSQGEGIDSVIGGLAGVSKDGKVINSQNLSKWNDNDFQGAVKKRFPEARVVIANDADLACLGETHFGAGKGNSIVAYFTISTGIGGGRVVDGKIDRQRFSFEPGWQIVEHSSSGFLEEMASGGAVKKKTGKKYFELSSEEAEPYFDIIASGIHNSVVHWSPDVVVLGGAVPLDRPESVEIVAKKVAQKMKIFPEVPEFKLAELGDLSALWGALALRV